jgi:hypothetical protein
MSNVFGRRAVVVGGGIGGLSVRWIVTLSRPEASGTTAFPPAIGGTSNGCPACPAECCRSLMRFAGSTRSTDRAWRPRPSKPDSCRLCSERRLPNRIRLRRRRPVSWLRSNLCSQTPWRMSTSADVAFPETRGERPENFEEGQQFEAALFRAVVADPVVHRAMTEVGQLLQPHDLFHEPHIMERIKAAPAKTFA